MLYIIIDANMQKSTRRCSSSQYVGEIYTMPVPFCFATKRRAQKWHIVPETTASPANKTAFHHVYDGVRSAPAIGLPEKKSAKNRLFQTIGYLLMLQKLTAG